MTGGPTAFPAQIRLQILQVGAVFPQGLAKKSYPTCRGDLLIISLGGFSLPRKLILGSIKSGGLLCLHSLPGLICLLRLLCLLRCLSIFCSFACYDCCAYFLALLTLLALLSLLAFLMCLGPRILTSFLGGRKNHDNNQQIYN